MKNTASSVPELELIKTASISICAFLLVASCLSPARAQTTPAAPLAQQSGDQTPTLSTNADEVSLDLVVHDKKHRPVLDLKAEDFAVTDEGTPVKLNQFRLVRGDENTGHLVTLVFDRFEGPLAKSAKTIADKVLKALPMRGYSFAVMNVSGRLRLLQPYTEDRDSVEQAIALALDNQATHMVSTLSQGVSITNDPAIVARDKAATEAERTLITIAQTGVDKAGNHVDLKERAKAQLLVKAMEDAQLIVQDQHADRSLAGLLALVRAQQQVTDRRRSSTSL